MKQDCFCRIADAYVCSCCRMRWERDTARAWSRRWKAVAKKRFPAASFFHGLCKRAEDHAAGRFKADMAREAAEARLAIAVEAIRAAQSAFSEDRVREEALDYNAFHIFCDKAAEALAAIEKGTK